MTDQPDLLAEFSNALAARAEAAKNAVVAIRLARGRHITGMVWRSGIVVTSEQSLPRNDDFELVGAGGSGVTARSARRGPRTKIAILRPPDQLGSPSYPAARRAGSLRSPPPARGAPLRCCSGPPGGGGVLWGAPLRPPPPRGRGQRAPTPAVSVCACRRTQPPPGAREK